MIPINAARWSFLIGVLCCAMAIAQSRPAVSIAERPVTTQPVNSSTFTLAKIDDAIKEGLSIPIVGRYEDLLAQASTRIEDWDLRVGIADPGEEAGPFIIMYCLADWKGIGEPWFLALSARNRLGPLAIECVDLDHPLKFMEGLSDRRLPGSKRYLFSVSVPLTDAGRWQIRLSDAGGTLKWSTALNVQTARPVPWQPFAHLTADDLKTWEHQYYKVRADHVQAVLPAYEGEIAGDMNEKNRWTGILPGLVDASKPPLFMQLSLQKNRFVVEIGDRKMLDWPDITFLARWWINGKPLQPPRLDTSQAMQMSRKVTDSSHCEIVFGLPNDLGDVKAGDKVGLQLMYCSKGVMPVPPPGGFPMASQLMLTHEMPNALPELTMSNRLEFALTPELLALREGASTRPSPKDEAP